MIESIRNQKYCGNIYITIIDDLREYVHAYFPDYETGYSLKQLAKEYGCSSSGLKEFLIKKGIDIKQKYSILNDQEKQIEMIHLYENRCMSVKDLLSKYHCLILDRCLLTYSSTKLSISFIPLK